MNDFPLLESPLPSPRSAFTPIIQITISQPQQPPAPVTQIEQILDLDEIDLTGTDSEIEYELTCEVCRRSVSPDHHTRTLADMECEICNKFYCTRCAQKFCSHFYSKKVEVYPRHKKPKNRHGSS